MRYLPKSDSERREMLDSMGLASMEDLYAHLPADLRRKRPLDIPPGKSEYEIIEYFQERAAENANGYASFLGHSDRRPVPG
ncbi:MAG: glycine dehydrogenase, partial [Acidobacteria bacterium]|nr:glycine dehydrogenase [Acidobacteriota bacterium]